jgi:group I intron endonuclease
MKRYKVYLITNTANNKKYVGITKKDIRERFKEHTKRGFALTEAIQKYGETNFTIEVIEEVNTPEEAYELEISYIKEINSKVPNGYNITDGGDGIFGWEVTEEYKQKCSEIVKELHKTKKVGMYGKTHTDETKKKMSASSRGKSKDWLRGKERTNETKKKISSKLTGKLVSEDTKKKISENHHDVSGENNPMFGKKHSPETIEKIRKKALERSLKKKGIA